MSYPSIDKLQITNRKLQTNHNDLNPKSQTVGLAVFSGLPAGLDLVIDYWNLVFICFGY
jgi:hypothetical protein